MHITISHPKRFLTFLAVFFSIIIVIIFFNRFFRVSTINISGNERYTQNEIRTMSGIEFGQHMWWLNTDDAMSKLAENPYIIPEVYKRYPSTVDIVIRERVAKAVMPLMNSWIMLDALGMVLEAVQDDSAISGIVRVTGVSTDPAQIKPGERLVTTNPLQYDALTAVLSAIELQEVSEMVYELNIADLDNIYLISKDNLMVILGDRENLGKKLQLMLSSIAGMNADGSYAPGILDVSIGRIGSFRAYEDADVTPPSNLGVGTETSPYGADKYPFDIEILVDWDNWN